MRYADAVCRYEEKTEPTHVYVFSGPCISCKKKISVEVPASGIYAYRQGALIQRAFPQMSKDDREFLMSGLCGECWDKMWKSSELEPTDEVEIPSEEE